MCQEQTTLGRNNTEKRNDTGAHQTVWGKLPKKKNKWYLKGQEKNAKKVMNMEIKK